jgi:hypothetical protein
VAPDGAELVDAELLAPELDDPEPDELPETPAEEVVVVTPGR